MIDSLLCSKKKFLERTTTIENPYFTYDPIQECEIVQPSHHEEDHHYHHHHRNGMIRVLGVDILPSEFPRDSSEHFGNAVTKVIQELRYAKSCQERSIHGIDPNYLSPGLVSLLE